MFSCGKISVIERRISVLEESLSCDCGVTDSANSKRSKFKNGGIS